MCQILNVLAGYSSHWNSTILGQIYTELFRNLFHLMNWMHNIVFKSIEQKKQNQKLLTCFGVMPVKQNIPIWSVMWSHGRDEPHLTRLFFSAVRTLIMRSAIPLTSVNHSARSFWSLRISRTMWAPWIGGFEYIGRIRIFSCDMVRAASSLSAHSRVKAPIRSPYRPKRAANYGTSVL